MTEPDTYVETCLNSNALYSNLNKEKDCLAHRRYEQGILVLSLIAMAKKVEGEA